MNKSKLVFCLCIMIFPAKGFAQSLDQQLLDAVRQNNYQLVEKLVKKGTDINKVDENGATPIMWAAYKSDLRVVKFLVSKGADLNQKGVIYLSPEKEAYYGSLIAIAAGEGKREIVKFLLEDCNINIEGKEFNSETKTESGWTALHWATYKGREEIINYLLSKGANINSQDNIGWTPLMLAAYTQNNDIYQYLLLQGADKTKVNDQGQTAGNILIGNSKALDVDCNQAVILYNNGKYFDAADLIAKWLPVLKEECGENDTTFYLKLLLFVENNYYEAGHYEKAEPMLVEAARITKETLGEYHPVYSTRLNNLALLYKVMGRFEQAEPMLLEATRIAKETLGDNHPGYSTILNNLALLYQAMGRYMQAEPMLQEATRIAKETLGDNHPDYSTSLNNLAALYSDMGRYEMAEPMMVEALRITKETLGDNHPDYSTRLNNLAQLYSDMGRYNQAEPMMIEAARITKETLGDNHPDYSTSLNNLAMLYHAMGRIEKAEPMMLEAMRITKESLGDNHPDYITRLSNLAQLYQDLGRYNQAEPMMIEAARITKETLGDNHPDYTTRLSNLAQLYSDMGRYEMAEPMMVEALRITKETLGDKNPDYSTCLNNLALLYKTMGRYEQAEPMMLEAARITKETLGDKHPDYSTRLNNLALLYNKMGRYQQAEPMMLEAMRITKESLGDNHPDYITKLSNLAQLYQDLGRYDQAESMMLEAARIAKETLGDYHPVYITSLNNLAALYSDMGRYEKSEPIMLEAARITKESLGSNHPDYSTRLNNLAQLYKTMGRYQQAEPMMIKAAKITKETLGDNHPDYSLCLNNLAQLNIAMGRYEMAEPMMVEAARITKETLGENHPDYSTRLNNLAQLNIAMGRYEQAQPMMQEAIRITKEILGDNHPDYSNRLNNLAQLYSDMGRYDQAETMMVEATRITKETLGENHPNYCNRLNNLGTLYQAMGRYPDINSLILLAFQIRKNHLSKNSGYLSETELNQFLGTFMFSLKVYQSCNLQQIPLSIENNRFALDIELYRKGLLLNSVIETRKIILNSGDTSLINNYQTMMTYRKQADILYTMPKGQRYEDPAKFEAKANDLEKDLKLRSKEFSQSIEEAEVTWKKVQDNLRPDEAVVEFASFEYFNKQWTDSTLYCALVLRKQDTMPHMVYLFEEKQLSEALPKPENSSDAAINSTYAVLRGTQLVPDSSWYQGDNLYNLVWNPLDSLLTGIKTVSYACSGLLNTVSFAAIPDATGKLLCEKYALNQYSSTRNLAIETEELPITDATIYGGIQYELDTTLMIANSRKYSKSDAFALAFNSTRSGNKRGNGFYELEGTREEANSINALFKVKKITTRNYTGAAANEESFKAMATKKSPSVIHLSTHGFYYPDTTTQRKHSNEIQYMGSDFNRFQYSPDPLLRSGIVLAGANRVWRGESVPDGVEDGILTAKDVSQLDLRNTQLVVLSACQTGLGDVKGSEGVFGLQRAFKMAGVRYLMMSLWSVPDKETKEFMEKFYTHWLSGIPIRKAFQYTQNEMRVQYPQEPFKWAAFVLVQ